MEYVDNPLDSAEAQLRRQIPHGDPQAYSQALTIFVDLDVKNARLSIRDNAEGMTREDLKRIIVNVGESKKRGVSWLNGQFGFGIHGRFCPPMPPVP